MELVNAPTINRVVDLSSEIVVKYKNRLGLDLASLGDSDLVVRYEAGFRPDL